MIFLVLLGADLLNSGLALTQMPVELANWVKDSGMAPLVVLAAILLIYILLGCVMDSLAMILLTIPIFYPVVMGLDFWGMSQGDKSIWFGILALMVVEIGLVTPPVGMNLYIINKMSRNVPLMETFKGVMPFLASDFIRIAPRPRRSPSRCTTSCRPGSYANTMFISPGATRSPRSPPTS
jgi:C4-dicarboxylate transporter DctM subunit